MGHDSAVEATPYTDVLVILCLPLNAFAVSMWISVTLRPEGKGRMSQFVIHF